MLVSMIKITSILNYGLRTPACAEIKAVRGTKPYNRTNSGVADCNLLTSI